VDLATIIGLIGAFALVFVAMMLGGSVAVFLNAPSMLIVFGGTIFVVLMKFNLSTSIASLGVAAKSFKFVKVDLNALLEELVALAELTRKGGLLALEESNPSNPFLKQGLQMLVDGYEQSVVRSTMRKDMDFAIERHTAGAAFFKAVGDVGPAMGMIGTLVGLVQMLSAMDDPKSIGPAMAVALLTTLYGSMLANMVALPFADKLELRRDEEAISKAMIIDSLIAIQDGQNPRIIEGMLRTYLPSSHRKQEEMD
jgi:chemotaxis protein MotA